MIIKRMFFTKRGHVYNMILNKKRIQNHSMILNGKSIKLLQNAVKEGI